MCLVLYRHTLLKAVVAHPEAREAVIENETWRQEEAVPKLKELNVFTGVPEAILRRLEAEGSPMYFQTDSVLLGAGTFIDEGMLYFILRGEVIINILGITTRRLGVGAAIGVPKFLGLECPAGQIEIITTSPCDILALKRETMAVALDDEQYEDDLAPYKKGISVLAGGEILGAFGFAIATAKYAPQCIEESEVLRACSEPFVAQIPLLVEEMLFWPGEKIYSQGEEGLFMYFVKAGRVRLEAVGRKGHEVVGGGATIGDMACLEQITGHSEDAIAETHVWVRALHRRLLQRALKSFPEEERRLMGSKAGGGPGLFD